MASKKITASGGSPIPASYSHSNSQSAALQTHAASRIRVINTTATGIYYTLGEVGVTPPTTNEQYVGPGAACTDDEIAISNNQVIYIRGESSITALDVHIRTWARR